MDDHSQKDEMREALLGDRRRALERWRDEGREPVFGPPVEERPQEPEPEPPKPAAEPEPAPVVEPEPPAAPVRGGWLRRLLRR